MENSVRSKTSSRLNGATHIKSEEDREDCEDSQAIGNCPTYGHETTLRFVLLRHPSLVFLG